MKVMDSISFNKLPLEVREGFIFGWALGVLQGNEELSSEAEAQIDSVVFLGDEGYKIVYSWVSGYKTDTWEEECHGIHTISSSEPIEETDSYLVEFDTLGSAVFGFHNALTVNCTYNEE